MGLKPEYEQAEQEVIAALKDESGTITKESLLRELGVLRDDIEKIDPDAIQEAFTQDFLNGRVWMTGQQVNTVGTLIAVGIFAGMGIALKTQERELDVASRIASSVLESFVAGYDGFSHDEEALESFGIQVEYVDDEPVGADG